MIKKLALAAVVISAAFGCVADPDVGSNQQSIWNDDFDPPVPDPPPQPDPEPLCSSSARTVRINTATLQGELELFLRGTRLQISHAGNGDTLYGEPRDLELKKNIPANKLDIFIADAEADCASAAAPAQCFVDRMSQLNDPVVHTITPQYNSYIHWESVAGSLLDNAVQVLNVPVVKKTLINKWWLKYTLPVSVTAARCYANNIHQVIDFNSDVRFSWSGNALRIQIPLETGSPALKCEGYGRFFGLGVGWADELFPDVELKNPKVTLTFGAFHVDNSKIKYKVSGASFTGSVDLNNMPGVAEDLIDLIKGFRKKIDNKIEAKLRKAINKDNVRDGLAVVFERLAKGASGQSSLAGRICDVSVGGGAMTVWYE